LIAALIRAANVLAAIQILEWIANGLPPGGFVSQAVGNSQHSIKGKIARHEKYKHIRPGGL
jgi:hypothetical protein